MQKVPHWGGGGNLINTVILTEGEEKWVGVPHCLCQHSDVCVFRDSRLALLT